MNVLLIVIVITGLLTTGCAVLGDIAIPPHEKSLHTFPEANCLVFLERPQEAEAFMLAPIAVEFIAGAVIDRAAKGLEEEAARYKASYSGRASQYLLQTSEKGETQLNVPGFVFTRLYGEEASKGCSSDTAEKSLELEVKVIISERGDTFELVPTRFLFNSAKSKVPSPKWYFPWSWWMFLDRSSNAVDVNAQITLSAVVDSKETRTPIDIAKVDIPLGKINLNDIGKPANVEAGNALSRPAHNTAWRDATDLSHLRSGWFVIPKSKPAGYGEDYLHITITVTVSEADELGDVIAKGNKAVADNKSKMIDALLKALDLKSKDK